MTFTPVTPGAAKVERQFPSKTAYTHAPVPRSQNIATITVQSHAKKHIIAVEDILYLEADHVYVNIHLAHDRPLMERGAISGLLKQLPSRQFMQTHRSYVVNLALVTHWDNTHVYIGPGLAIPVSRRLWKEVNTRLEKRGGGGR